LLALISRAGSAQSSGVELGVDGMIEHTAGATIVSIPVALFRVGFFVSPQVSIEPFVNFNSTHGNGTFTTGRVGAGLLWHFTAATSGVQPYIRPFIEDDFAYVSGRQNTAGSAVFGIGLGLKIPLADRLRWRIEGAYASATGESRIMGLVGLSFFTH